jgi:hypothetical protein
VIKICRGPEGWRACVNTDEGPVGLVGEKRVQFDKMQGQVLGEGIWLGR